MAKILVVDDTKSILRSAEAMLLGKGHEVSTAENGVEAMSIIIEQDGGLDLIICDLNMPEVDGYQLYMWIVTEFPNLVKKFVFHTDAITELNSYETTKDVRKMDKPGKSGEFMDTVNSMLYEQGEVQT